MIPAQEALKLLRDGNARFVSDTRNGDAATGSRRRIELAAQQYPFAIILGCSDSRVPAEIVFDQGLGDLFVIRVAGNIVAPSQIGSVEFAAERYGTRLVVVLGHSSCGAIMATLEELSRNSREQSPNLRSIVNRVRPSIQPLLSTSLAERPGGTAAACRAREHPYVGRSPAPRLRAARTAHSKRRPAHRRRRVQPRNRCRRVLRRHGRLSATGTPCAAARAPESAAYPP